MVEVYKKIKEYNNYSISNWGNVRNDKSMKILKLTAISSGTYVILYKHGKCKRFHTYILVKYAFGIDLWDY